MGSKFKGFEGCFSMTINTTSSDLLQRLRDTNDRRKQLDIKIAKGRVTKLDMMEQLKIELRIFDAFLKTIDNKRKIKECCAVINKVISKLIKRINNMWNSVFLLFTVNDELEPEFLNVSKSVIISSCTNCSNCDLTIESIISSIEIVSIQGGPVFNFSSSDFIKILQTTAFVDKTLMIKEVFQDMEMKGIVITAPRKYGKSTNLSMLKYFLEIQVDSLGKPLTKAKANKPVTDTSNYELFKNLKISKEANIMNNHFGKYPVLYANFKLEKCIKSYNCVVEGCKEIIHKSFQLHKYLQKSSKLSIKQKKLCKLWCGDVGYKKLKNVEQIYIGLRLLSIFLTQHYGKPCFVLIDELDFFTSTVSITKSVLRDYKVIVMFIRQLLLFLKNNNLVVNSFLTGKSGYAIHSIVPTCVQVQSFYNFHKFTDFYGLTTNELEYLFKKSEFKQVLISIEEIKDYYSSYFKIDESSMKEIFCIWSILNVLRYKRLDNYWRDFGNIFCNLSNPIFNYVFQKLRTDDLVMAVIQNKPIKPVRKLRPTPPPIIAVSKTLTKQSLDYFLNLMLDLGYLTCGSTALKVLDSQNKMYSSVAVVRIPNKEVEHDIETKISLLS